MIAKCKVIVFFITELLLQQRNKRISMVSMNSQESNEEDRNDDKCKYFCAISFRIHLKSIIIMPTYFKILNIIKKWVFV